MPRSPVVKVVRLPDLPLAGDIVDFVEARRAADCDDATIHGEIQTLIDAAESIAPNEPTAATTGDADSGPRPVLIDLSTVTPEEINWLWPGRFARGKFSLLVGHPGIGKSFLSLDIVSRVSTGQAWPDQPGEQREPGSAIILTGEDDLGDTVVPRLMAMRADLTRVRALDAIAISDDKGQQREWFFRMDRDIAMLQKAISSIENCQLIVVDPLQCYLGERENNCVEDIRSITAELTRLAVGTGLRAGELRSLTAGSFDFQSDPPTVTIKAAYAKNGRDDILPLQSDLAHSLAEYTLGMDDRQPLFRIPEKTAKLIRDDLASARAQWIDESGNDAERDRRSRSDFLTYRDHAGEVADFHCLRHTFITNLISAGVKPHTAQLLARHSTITLTMDR
ncbi:MAG: hypothetical protein HJJLKODD_03032 [Phycisphaerae bacterium]|nr:hypothetical protein [Phycisphaerae bacterium]